MQRALRLARRGRDRTSPNPMVGAVVVRSGRIVGEGYTQPPGGPHAEVVALTRAGSKARGADVYVTLEPCGHQGRTPPCSEALVAAGVARVFYAVGDPNPATRGRGPRRLRSAGIEARLGPCRTEALELNAPYFHWRRNERPWVLLKWAMTLDGKIATAGGESKWITGASARRYAHVLRRRVDAVLVGTGTVRRDNPELLPRPARGRLPFRIVLDRQARLPLDLTLLARPIARGGAPTDGTVTPGVGQTIYVTTRACGVRRRAILEARGAAVVVVPAPRQRFGILKLLERLSGLGISQLLVEGGGRLAAAFVEVGAVDEVAAFIAPRLLGGADAKTPVDGRGTLALDTTPWLVGARCRRLGEDFLVEGRVKPRA